MNAYTPLEQQKLKYITDTFPVSPYFNVYKEINRLGIGEAIVSFLQEDGSPGITDKIAVLPPQSKIGLVPNELRRQIIDFSPLKSRYEKVVF